MLVAYIEQGRHGHGKRNERKEENNGLECVCIIMLRNFNTLGQIRSLNFFYVHNGVILSNLLYFLVIIIYLINLTQFHLITINKHRHRSTHTFCNDL